MKCRKIIIWFLFGLAVFINPLTYAQEMVFSARAEANKVGLDDQFRLVFTLKNAPNSTEYKPPSFSDFIIRGGPSQSQSHQINVINGKTEQSSTVELTYVLQAKRLGKLKIDPLEIIIDNKHYFTNAVMIEVVKGSVAQKQNPQRGNPRGFDPFGDDDDFWKQQDQALRQMMQRMQQMQQNMPGNMPPGMIDPRAMDDLSDLDQKNLDKNIFIKVEVGNTTPYVGEQITAKYKLYTRLNMNMQLTQLPSLNGFWSEDFKIPSPPQPTIEVVNGKKFNVFLLKKSALFPQQSGQLTLDPTKAEGEVQVADFTNSRYGYNVKNIKTSLSSAPVRIQVKELPKANQPNSFTGGVGKFTIRAILDSNVISTDNPGILKFEIKGAGNLNLIAAPQTRFPEPLGVSEPQVEDTILSRSPTISGKKTFTYFLSPQQVGDFMIPSFDFSYFDPETKQYHSLKTQEIKLKVTEGKNPVIAKNNLPSDIHDIEKGDLFLHTASTGFFIRPVYFSLYAFAFIIFLLLLFLFKRKEKEQADLSSWKNKKANKVAWKRLASARKLLNSPDNLLFYEEVSKAIWLYLSDKLSLPISILSKDNIAEQLKLKNISESTIQKVHEQLSECEMALYSPSGTKKQRIHVLDHTSDLIAILEKELKNNS